MKNGTKKIVSLLMALILMLSLVACGGGEKPSEAPASEAEPASTPESSEAEPASEPIVIEHLHLGDWIKPIFDQATQDFLAEKNIQVNVQYSPWDGAYEKYMTLINADSLPDVGFIFHEWMGEFTERGVIKPVSPYISENLSNEMLPAIVDNLTYQGELMAVPFISSIRPYIYRSDVFEENGIAEPKNWDDVVAAANKLYNPPESYGYGLCAGRNKYTVEFFMTIFYTLGGEFITEDGGAAAFNDDAGLRAMQIFADLAKTAPEGYLTSDGILVENVWASSNVFQTVYGCWIISNLLDANPEAQYSVANIEGDNGDKASLYVIDCFGLFTDDEAKAKACMDWIEYFKTSEEYMNDSYDYYTLPPDLKCQYEWPFVEDNSIINAILPCLDYGKTKPVIPEWSQVEDQLALACEKVCLGEATPEQALSDAEAAVNEILAG